MNTILLIATIYGSIVSNNFVKAPYAVRIGEWVRVTETVSETEANSVGYKMMEDCPPPCDSNHYAVATGWAETNRIYRVYEVREVPPPPPRKFSKLKIYGAIVALPERNGETAWNTVHAWLEAKTINGVNGWMAFQLAQEISEDHPLFAPLANEAQALLVLTDEQFATLLSSCILED